MVLKKVKLKEVLETNISGEWGKDPVEGSQTSINIIRTTNFSNDGRIDFSNIIKREVDLKKIEQKKLKYGDIIIEKSGGSPTQPVGRVIFFNLSSEDIYLCNNFTAILRCNSKVFPKYLLYYLLNAYKKNKTLNFQNKTTGIINLQLSRYIKELEIPLPPIEIQIKIAEALDKAQELIDNRKLQLEKYDELIQSTFIDMFGDPVTNPKKWEIDKLGNKCEIYRGGSPRPISNFLGGTIPWIKIGDATKGDNIYLHKTKEHIIEEGIRNSRFVEKGELIFANCGVSLGFARILKFDGCIHDGWLVFKNISQNIEKIFLLKLLNCYTDYFRKTAPDGTQPNLNTSIMKDFKIILPTIELQNKFSSIVEVIENEKKLCEESLKQMEENFNSIIDKAFKGELF